MPRREWQRVARRSAYHGRVALRELSRREILQAVAEYDRLGQDRFLEEYGFGAARSYRLVVEVKLRPM